MEFLKVYGYSYDFNKCAIHPNPKKMTNGVYAHGKLDIECGFDLVWIPDEGRHLTKPHLEKVIFVYPDGRETFATLYSWHTSLHNWYGSEDVYKGLVVKVGDTEAEEFAKKKYEERADYL